ncbi:MAG: hypothetical protein QOH26_379, partial [Actinomycetota bacterium]|nr:hypothetical protein [Actinomycetota bacterium]
ARYSDWVDRYVAAWNSNDPAEIADLFTDDARYFDTPIDEPWVGKNEIVKEWLARKDEPGDAEFSYEIIVATPDIGILRAETRYLTTGTDYANLWEIRLDASGACREFVEWYMERKQL